MFTGYITYFWEDEIVRNAFRRQERRDKMTNRPSLCAHRAQCECIHAFMSVAYTEPF